MHKMYPPFHSRFFLSVNLWGKSLEPVSIMHQTTFWLPCQFGFTAWCSIYPTRRCQSLSIFDLRFVWDIKFFQNMWTSAKENTLCQTLAQTDLVWFGPESLLSCKFENKMDEWIKTLPSLPASSLCGGVSVCGVCGSDSLGLLLSKLSFAAAGDSISPAAGGVSSMACVTDSSVSCFFISGICYEQKKPVILVYWQ